MIDWCLTSNEQQNSQRKTMILERMRNVYLDTVHQLLLVITDIIVFVRLIRF
jgi:hypothetical protein